jgi:hypothetical protein
MNRSLLLPAMLAATLAAPLAFPAASEAQVYAGPYLAYHDDYDLGVGFRVGFPFPETREEVLFFVDTGFFFPDRTGPRGAEVDYWEANANVVLRFPLEDNRFTPWAMSGLNLGQRSVGMNLGPFDDDERDTDMKIGLNIGAGMTFATGPISPFAGAKMVIGGGGGPVVFGGVSFRLGLEGS